MARPLATKRRAGGGGHMARLVLFLQFFFIAVFLSRLFHRCLPLSSLSPILLYCGLPLSPLSSQSFSLASSSNSSNRDLPFSSLLQFFFITVFPSRLLPSILFYRVLPLPSLLPILPALPFPFSSSMRRHLKVLHIFCQHKEFKTIVQETTYLLQLRFLGHIHT